MAWYGKNDDDDDFYYRQRLERQRDLERSRTQRHLNKDETRPESEPSVDDVRLKDRWKDE
jgi:hypothetical protein